MRLFVLCIAILATLVSAIWCVTDLYTTESVSFSAITTFLAALLAFLLYATMSGSRPIAPDAPSELVNQRVPVQEPATAVASTEFQYPALGRHGMNLLDIDTSSARVGDSFSMRAVIPAGSSIRVTLTGPLAIYLDDGGAAWSYSVNTQNWIGQRYLDPPGKLPEQTFVAEEGIADLELHLSREGDIRIDVYEGQVRSPTWTKTITVLR